MKPESGYSMKKTTVKRTNINLNQDCINAIERIKEKTGIKNESDAIRAAILTWACNLDEDEKETK